jgi:hypothetical protein
MGDEIEPHRPQDHHFRGNIVQAMVAYAEGRLGDQKVALKDVSRIIAIGSDRMMNAVRLAATARCSRISIRSTSASAASTRRCSA